MKGQAQESFSCGQFCARPGSGLWGPRADTEWITLSKRFAEGAVKKKNP